MKDILNIMSNLSIWECREIKVSEGATLESGRQYIKRTRWGH